ncbi:MAG: hypothetical protein ACI4KR_00555 [Ruminiclostridium sp.]
MKMNEYSEKMKVISPYMENTDIMNYVQQSYNSVFYEKNFFGEEAKLLMENVRMVLEDMQS